MTWLTWRQFRAQASTVTALVAALCVVLAVTGPRLADLAHRNSNVYDLLTRTDRNLLYAGVVVLALAPALIGAFWGAPLVARELETGTHRLVWSQSVTRARWLRHKLGVTVGAAALVTGALTLAVTWWSEPIDGALSSAHGNLPSRMTPVSFAMRGLAPVGYTVFAVVLGATVGAVLRRSLPAMAVTLALFTFVQIAVPLWVRPHLAPPVHVTTTFSPADLDGLSINGGDLSSLRLSVRTGAPGSWVLTNETVDAEGRRTALPAWMSNCLPPPPTPGVAGPVKTPGFQGLAACLTRLNDEGYRQRIVYLPTSRFWRLQWTETGLFLALSGLLAGCCLWWTTRRLS